MSGGDATSRYVTQKLRAAVEIDKLMLDSMISPDGAFPYSTLQQIRRSLVRDILQRGLNLAELRGFD